MPSCQVFSDFSTTTSPGTLQPAASDDFLRFYETLKSSLVFGVWISCLAEVWKGTTLGNRNPEKLGGGIYFWDNLGILKSVVFSAQFLNHLLFGSLVVFIGGWEILRFFLGILTDAYDMGIFRFFWTNQDAMEVGYFLSVFLGTLSTRDLGIPLPDLPIGFMRDIILNLSDY